MRPSIELDYDTSAELLAGQNIGRVGLCTPAGPRILPVSYAVVEDSVIFRTEPFCVLGTYAWNSQLAFEVDTIEPGTRTGWSVVATGRGAIISDPGELSTARSRWEPQPRDDGPRLGYVRLRWTELTGRRFSLL